MVTQRRFHGRNQDLSELVKNECQRGDDEGAGKLLYPFLIKGVEMRSSKHKQREVVWMSCKVNEE